MASAFQRRAIQRLIDQATALGVEVPEKVTQICTGGRDNHGAVSWANAHPDDDTFRGCCWGEVNGGADSCTCWTPVYDVAQADPIPPTSPDDLVVQRRMCGDCAFRKGSPERADAYAEEALLSLAAERKPFWCHDGMRRPVRWEHPDGRSIGGDPDDWSPPMVAGVPYRADGRPGLLCAGWVARAARVDAVTLSSEGGN